MSEILRDSDVVFGLGLASAQDVTATVKLNNNVILEVVGDTFDLPSTLLSDNGVLTIEWSFTFDGISTHKRTEVHEVVTPYVTLTELRDYDPAIEVLSDDKILELESRARGEIYRATGQHFWSNTDSITVYGQNDWTLNVPQRILSLDDIHYLNGATQDLQDLGVFLKDEYTLGYAPQAYNLLDTSITYGGVIYAPPSNYDPFFRQDTAFVVTGTFGWDTVPNDIVLATKMLVKDYVTDTTTDTYRQKNVKRLQTGTWSVEFGSNDSGYNTGNSEVDKILDQYRLPGMAVI